MHILKKSLPSLCTSNFDVLKAAIIFCKLNNIPILIESTSNQVNQFGGYTNLKPIQFVKKINKIAKKVNLKKNMLIIGADHLGTLPWSNLKENYAMKNAIKLFKDTVKSGYKKIHIDTGVKLKNDIFFSKKIIFERSKKIYQSTNKKKFKNIIFVFGTEVPFAGGQTVYKQKNTNVKAIIEDLKVYKKLTNKFGLVIEPGLGFTNNKIYKLKMGNFSRKKHISIKNNFYYEAHSSDYQSLNSLKKLVKNNFKFLKVGPELTYFFMKAILNMEKIEKKEYSKNLSNIKYNISKAMNKDSKNWIKYYSGSKKKIEYLKFNSFMDRIRYYWNKENVPKSLLKLKKNINLLDINIVFQEIKITKKYYFLIKKFKLSIYDLIVFSYLLETLKKYYQACNFKIKYS